MERKILFIILRKIFDNETLIDLLIYFIEPYYKYAINKLNEKSMNYAFREYICNKCHGRELYFFVYGSQTNMYLQNFIQDPELKRYIIPFEKVKCLNTNKKQIEYYLSKLANNCNIYKSISFDNIYKREQRDYIIEGKEELFETITKINHNCFIGNNEYELFLRDYEDKYRIIDLYEGHNILKYRIFYEINYHWYTSNNLNNQYYKSLIDHRKNFILENVTY